MLFHQKLSVTSFSHYLGVELVVWCKTLVLWKDKVTQCNNSVFLLFLGNNLLIKYVVQFKKEPK